MGGLDQQGLNPKNLILHIPTYQLWVFSVAFVLRAVWFLIVYFQNPEGFFSTDSWQYIRIAQNITAYGEYSQGQFGEQSFIPDALRTPGYPLTIILCNFLGINLTGLLILQLFVGALTCSIVARVAFMITRRKSLAVLSGLLLALNIPSIFFTTNVMTESIFTLLLLIGIARFIRWLQQGSMLQLFISALLIGVSMLFRPIALYLPLALVVLVLCHKGGFQNLWRPALITLAIPYMLISPWVMRNNAVFGKPFVSTVSDINLLFHTGSNIRAIKENRSLSKVQEEYHAISGSQYDWQDPGATVKWDEFARREAVGIIASNPVIFAQNYSGSFFYFFTKPLRSYIDVQLGYVSGYGSIASVTQDRFHSLISKAVSNTSKLTLVLVVVQLLMMVLVTTCAFRAMVVMIRTHRTIVLLLVGVILYFAVISSLTEVDARMRVPVEPYLSLLAAFGLVPRPRDGQEIS